MRLTSNFRIPQPSFRSRGPWDQEEPTRHRGKMAEGLKVHGLNVYKLLSRKTPLLFNTLLKISQHQMIKMDITEIVVLLAIALFSPDDRWPGK